RPPRSGGSSPEGGGGGALDLVLFRESRAGSRSKACPLPPSAPSPAARGKERHGRATISCRFPRAAAEAPPKGVEGVLLISSCFERAEQDQDQKPAPFRLRHLPPLRG